MAKYAPAMKTNAPTRSSSSHPALASKARSTSAPANVDTIPTTASAIAGNRQSVVSMEDSRLGSFAWGKNLRMALGDPRAKIWAKMVPHAVKIRNKPQPSSKPSKALGNTYIVLMAPKSSPVARAMLLRADCLATMPMVQS